LVEGARSKNAGSGGGPRKCPGDRVLKLNVRKRSREKKQGVKDGVGGRRGITGRVAVGRADQNNGRKAREVLGLGRKAEGPGGGRGEFCTLKKLFPQHGPAKLAKEKVHLGR